MLLFSESSAYFLKYSKIQPLRNCVIRNSGPISLNKIPFYKKLSRMIHVQFLLQWYLVIFYSIYLNMSAIGLIFRNKNERFKPKLL